MNTPDLMFGLKSMVIRECNVRSTTADQIEDGQQLIGGTGNLQLDSLDAVEIVSALEKHFAVKLESAGASRKVFKSFVTMADYVVKHADSTHIEKFIQQYKK